MKKILLLVTVFSFSFAGTFYVEMGQSPQYTLHNEDLDLDISTDLDKGGLTVGYNHGFFQSGSWSLAVGGSYTLNPITGFRQESGMRFEPVDSEVGFASLYLLPVYQIGEKFFGWASIGLTKGLYDLDHEYEIFNEDKGVFEDHSFKNGPTIGFGIHIKCDETYGVGFGFTNNQVSLDGDDYNFNRTSIFFTAKVN